MLNPCLIKTHDGETFSYLFLVCCEIKGQGSKQYHKVISLQKLQFSQKEGQFVINLKLKIESNFTLSFCRISRLHRFVGQDVTLLTHGLGVVLLRDF